MYTIDEVEKLLPGLPLTMLGVVYSRYEESHYAASAIMTLVWEYLTNGAITEIHVPGTPAITLAGARAFGIHNRYLHNDRPTEMCFRLAELFTKEFCMNDLPWGDREYDLSDSAATILREVVDSPTTITLGSGTEMYVRELIAHGLAWNDGHAVQITEYGLLVNRVNVSKKRTWACGCFASVRNMDLIDIQPPSKPLTVNTAYALQMEESPNVLSIELPGNLQVSPATKLKLDGMIKATPQYARGETETTILCDDSTTVENDA